MQERGHGAGGFQPTLVCHTPAGISIQRDEGKERREKSEEKVRKLVLRRKYGLAKGPGVTVLVPRPQDTPQPQQLMDHGLPAHLASSSRGWNDDLAGITIPAETGGRHLSFLNTRMVSASAALALSSSNWCHQDQHCLKISRVVSILIISLPFSVSSGN